ncbi:MAG: DEAD/DEAH box helicase [Deltaproteobacteria bacterium]|nr:DEAD/DEAH box helicase [Deltaproteobacteria bacterium]
MENQRSQLAALLDAWGNGPQRRHFCCLESLPARSAEYCALPAELDQRLVEALRSRGITQLYRHQAEAYRAVQAGNHVVIATPTASGKTLCYSLPVFQRLLNEPRATALYLFPTKALARDQVSEARALANAALGQEASVGQPQAEIGVVVYDGDTPVDQRRVARRRARILATNPDMLHTGILPHHPAWSSFLAGLRYVVIDELHVYRGVFGSHVAHVLRRLDRIARFYGAAPITICSSATIANPDQLAERLIGQRVVCLRESGAPSGPRHFWVYNPPLVDRALGLRQNYIKSTCELTEDLIAAEIDSLVFCRTRLAVEVMVRQLRDRLAAALPADRPAELVHQMVRGYRGGYLPARRRAVESGLKAGQTQAVVTTSALELGIDIGNIDAVVLAGWPGSRAAAWQRAGRAGRRLNPSLALLVASSAATDQFVAEHSDYLFGQQPEHARIDPDNASILVPQIKCAAYELPFARQETYGELGAEETAEVLDCLADAQQLHRDGDAFHFVGDAFPAAGVSLRGPAAENFLVVRTDNDAAPSGSQGQIIAEVDYDDAPQELHDHAIYQLEGQQFEVLRLDHDNHKAFVRRVDVDYYTDALTQTRIRVLRTDQQHPRTAAANLGEIHLETRVTGFKKIKHHTHENVGFGDVVQPERQMHTSALWVSVPGTQVALVDATFAEIAEAALGMSRTLHTAATLLLMGDGGDIGRAIGDARADWFPVVSRGQLAVSEPLDGQQFSPTVFLYDRFPGGIGLAERLFEDRLLLVARAKTLLERCGCERGCPACIGPGGSGRAKPTALLLLRYLQLALAS